MMRKFSKVIILWIALTPWNVQAEASDFKPADLDQLIERAMPRYPGTVEVLPLHKVQFSATVAALPSPRKTFYLLDVLANWRVKPLPEVRQGMAIWSLNGQSLNVYMEQSVAERATETLSVDDKVSLYGYHVYNSKHGPGILIADFQLQRDSVFENFKTLLKQNDDQ